MSSINQSNKHFQKRLYRTHNRIKVPFYLRVFKITCIWRGPDFLYQTWTTIFVRFLLHCILFQLKYVSTSLSICFKLFPSKWMCVFVSVFSAVTMFKIPMRWIRSIPGRIARQLCFYNVLFSILPFCMVVNLKYKFRNLDERTSWWYKFEIILIFDCAWLKFLIQRNNR